MEAKQGAGPKGEMDQLSILTNDLRRGRKSDTTAADRGRLRIRCSALGTRRTDMLVP